ncbi:MAG: hypothetical protein JSR90_17200 [Proteobacteria bacterium]|nr:hypothetical protein [Pseudomonadota bacterium]
MDESHVPAIGLRYWILLLLATTVAAFAGCVMTIPFGLPLGIKLIPLSAILVVIFLLERRDESSTDAWYWAAVAVIGAAGARIADISTGALELDYLYLVVGLVILLGMTFAVGQSEETRLISRLQVERARPSADLTHWIGMIVASVLGAVASDLVKTGFQLGPLFAGALFAAMLGGFYCLFRFTRANRLLLFWCAVSLVSAEGGCIGRFVGSRQELGVSLVYGALFVVGPFVATLLFWRDRLGRS